MKTSSYLLSLLMLLCMVLSCETLDPRGMTHIIVLSTDSQEAAIARAKELRDAGYSGRVYLTKTGWYTVTMSAANEAQAKLKREQAMTNKLIDNSSYISSGDGFQTQIFPSAESKVYLVIGQTDKKDDAIKLAERLREKAYEVQVYETSQGLYAITIGYYAESQAQMLKEQAIRDNVATSKSYTSDGAGFVRLIYPQRGSGFYVVMQYAQNESDARQLAETLTRRNYSAEVYLTGENTYAVTAGFQSEAESQELLEELRKKNFSGTQPVLADGRNFKRRVYPAASSNPLAQRNNTLSSGQPVTNAGNTVYLIVGSSKSRSDAILTAQALISKGYAGCEVFTTPTKQYAISLGEYPVETADQIMQKAIAKGDIRRDTYKATARMLDDKVFP